MINIFISFLFGIISISFFSFNFQISNLNKTILNIPISLFEVSIPLDKDSFYFNQEDIEKRLKEYFDSSLNNLNKNYELNLSYYSTSDGLFCKSLYCDGVNVNFKSNILFFEYEREMFYQIEVKNENRFNY